MLIPESKILYFLPNVTEKIPRVGGVMMPIQRPDGSFVSEHRRKLTKSRQRKANDENNWARGDGSC